MSRGRGGLGRGLVHGVEREKREREREERRGRRDKGEDRKWRIKFARSFEVI
jgi:hypothetical protein